MKRLVALTVVIVLAACSPPQSTQPTTTLDIARLCGDGVCGGPENPGNCPQDCPQEEVTIEAADWVITLGTVDGTIKPLLGVNVGPIPAGEPGNADLTDGYRMIGVNAVRTHDYYGPLDMATMYPDQSVDPADPASYDFTASDEVFAAIVNGGFEPYLRIGDSWNNAPGFPPADPRQPVNKENWIKAAVEVVRHYNDPALWGGSYLRCVEIWNEPDGRFWDGSREAFFELFADTAVSLKTAYPDLMIGGPGLTPAGYLAPQGQKYTEGFLDYMQVNHVPLDFFSWHIYSNDPADFVNAAAYYRQMLDSRGYTTTESHLSEWNIEIGDRSLPVDAVVEPDTQPAILTAAWIGLQREGVDAALFYRGSEPSSRDIVFFGPFYSDGQLRPIGRAFSLWSEMAMHPERLDIAVSPHTGDGQLWALAGQGDHYEVAVLIANPSETDASWSMVLPDGRPVTDYYVVFVRGIDGSGREIVPYSPSGPIVEIGAYAVQLVILQPLEI